MTPTHLPAAHFSRRALLAAGLAGAAALCGCASPAINSTTPDAEQIVELGLETKLVGDISLVSGTQFVKIESVALCTGLDGTGSDPPPSTQRAILVADMQARNVQEINDVLASPNTSLVLCKAYLPPGVQKGDRVDVEVRVQAKSETKSLRGGWLMPARMEEVAVLGGELRRGRVLGTAQGPILVDSILAGNDDPQSAVRGRIPGGAVSLHERNFGLVLLSEYQSVQTASRMGNAINDRFHLTDRGGNKRGVANPKRDNFVDLAVHPRYRHNLGRYLSVIRSIAVHESGSERAARLQTLEKQLLVPTLAANAALRLEALGADSLDALVRGLQSADPEVRFYAAEAMAYLGDKRAAKPLAEMAKNEPAFRWHALAALSSMDQGEDMTAYEELSEMLSSNSAETRYGAFRALWAMNPHDPLVKGEMMGREFSYHIVETTGDPMIHISRTRRPEIVIFGSRQELRTPFVLFAGKEIMVKGGEDGRVKLSRFAPGKPDRQETCGANVDELIRALVRIEADYGDIIEALQQAKSKEKDALAARVVIDALPAAGRTYERKTGEPGGDPSLPVHSPLPSLFFSRGSGNMEEEDIAEPEPEPEAESTTAVEAPPAEETSQPSFIGRIFGWK